MTKKSPKRALTNKVALKDLTNPLEETGNNKQESPNASYVKKKNPKFKDDTTISEIRAHDNTFSDDDNDSVRRGDKSRQSIDSDLENGIYIDNLYKKALEDAKKE